MSNFFFIYIIRASAIIKKKKCGKKRSNHPQTAYKLTLKSVCYIISFAIFALPLIDLISFAILAFTLLTVSPSASETVTVNNPLRGIGLMAVTVTPASQENVTCGCPGAQSSRVFSGAKASSVYLISMDSSWNVTNHFRLKKVLLVDSFVSVRLALVSVVYGC